jgi:hypothetical protein
LQNLYREALDHLLAGGWRGDPPADHVLREARRAAGTLAWRAAEQQNDDVTGLADWSDSVDAEIETLSEEAREALDHIAPVVDRGQLDTRERRRFLHQTFRERLVAERIATFDVDTAAAVIEPHLWFDPTWETIIPGAVAQHAEPASLVRLACFDSRHAMASESCAGS